MLGVGHTIYLLSVLRVLTRENLLGEWFALECIINNIVYETVTVKRDLDMNKL